MLIKTDTELFRIIRATVVGNPVATVVTSLPGKILLSLSIGEVNELNVTNLHLILN